jgi:hypothetical protein
MVGVTVGFADGAPPDFSGCGVYKFADPPPQPVAIVTTATARSSLARIVTRPSNGKTVGRADRIA